LDLELIANIGVGWF